jgi:hypothetical protein
METASVMINLHKDNEIKPLKEEKDAADAEHTAITKMKEEVNILKQIKEHRSPIAIYNTLKMFIIICTKEISQVDRFSLQSIRVSGMWSEPEGLHSPLLPCGLSTR